MMKFIKRFKIDLSMILLSIILFIIGILTNKMILMQIGGFIFGYFVVSLIIKNTEKQI